MGSDATREAHEAELLSDLANGGFPEAYGDLREHLDTYDEPAPPAPGGRGLSECRCIDFAMAMDEALLELLRDRAERLLAYALFYRLTTSGRGLEPWTVRAVRDGILKHHPLAA